MTNSRIAYFSMEIALDPRMPTYSGGLGVLAGDTIRSASDMGLALVGVTLLHRKGYFSQQLDSHGVQREQPVEWAVEEFVEAMPARVSVAIEGRTVAVRAWRFHARGVSGAIVPVYLLDTDLPENHPDDRALSSYLYGGDATYRLSQEIVLGIGGVRMLRALGYTSLDRFHMNEGHSSLLTLELLDEAARSAGRATFGAAEVQQVRRLCVFTTHTPVPAGHDHFPLDLVHRILGRPEIPAMKEVFCRDDELDMTHLALNLSRYVNGVAKRHGETSRLMFTGYRIDAITNGVHVATWTAPAFAKLFDRYVPDWRADSFSLRYALGIPAEDVWRAHQEAKQDLLQHVHRLSGVAMAPDVLTIGVARRATLYKRLDLLVSDIGRLAKIAAGGRLQVVYAGKAHPRDHAGKDQIRRIVAAIATLQSQMRIVFLENYDADLAKVLVAGADVWLNTAQPPLEASGTSGMKAALNGVPSLSVLDGWWIEGHIEGVTGWSIGDDAAAALAKPSYERDGALLYDKLEHVIMPMFYEDRDGFVDVMRHAIGLNGSFFNTQRMLLEYAVRAYLH